MNKFVFLDRDGTINEDPGYVHKIEDFKFIPKAIDGLKLLSESGFKFVIITNQSGIGRGYYTKEDMDQFNSKLIEELKKDNIKIEKTYYCPHSPDESCGCRKPSTKYMGEAKKEFNINLENSYVIGDHPHDVEMGKKAGCKSIYVLTGHGKKHREKLKEANFVAQDLHEAAKWILNNKQ